MNGELYPQMISRTYKRKYGGEKSKDMVPKAVVRRKVIFLSKGPLHNFFPPLYFRPQRVGGYYFSSVAIFSVANNKAT
jgi:hypothetical protein